MNIFWDITEKLQTATEISKGRNKINHPNYLIINPYTLKLPIDEIGKKSTWPLTIRGGLVYPLNYETVQFTLWTLQNWPNHPLKQFWTVVLLQ
jgi:hypothetical protein